MREGEACEDMFIILSGRLRVQSQTPDGTGTTIAELGAGETVGEMALVTGNPRVATVYAVRDSQLARLSKGTFLRLLERHPRTTFDLVTSRLVSRLRVETARLPRHHALSTIAVVPAAPDAPLRAVSERLASGLSRLGSTLHVWSGMVDAQLGAAGIAQSFDRDHHGGHLVEWLAQQELEHRFVLYESDARLTPWTERCVRQADHVVVVADAAGDPGVGEIESELLYGSRRPVPRRTLALVHYSGTRPPSGTARWLEKRQVTRHVHVRFDSPADFDRLARHVTGNVIGLALGGGFARGLAHLGVFQAFADAGIAVDVIGGSSMGALIGAQWAMGWTADEIAKRTSRGFGTSFDDMTLPFLALKRGGKHSRLIRSFFADTQIEDLWLPYFAVSSNLNRSSLVVHTSGPLADAVTASTRAPGLFPPVVIGSELHVDGGVMNNVPVDVMREFTEGGIVIGADVSPPHELGEVDNYGHDVSGWRAAWRRFNPLRSNRSYLPDIVLVLLRVVEFGGISYRRDKASMADIYIAPDVLCFKRNDFGRSADLIEAGYVAAQDALRKWLNEGDESYRVRRPDLFCNTAASGSAAAVAVTPAIR
jgi:NTE family protein/lysophospholipid hydrolase